MCQWTKLPPYEGKIHQGCLNCPPVLPLAPADMVIAVGFGSAGVYTACCSKTVYQEAHHMDEKDMWTTEQAEAAAAADPEHDWRIQMLAPLRDREYQRQGENQWVLISSGPGFA